MNALYSLFRFISICHIIFKYNLLSFFIRKETPFLFKLLYYISPFCLNISKSLKRGERFRYACEDLGSIFIKFGQLFSIRSDVFPNDIIVELSKLQDKVKPFCGLQAKSIVEKSYNDSIENIFKEFDIRPIASASIAQVHKAILKNDDIVAIKILRPNIDVKIKKDLMLIGLIAKICNKFFSHTNRLKPVDIVNEIKKTILNELDLTLEASNAVKLTKNSFKLYNFYIPRINWNFTKKNILVAEMVDGIQINNIEKLRELNFNLELLAKRLVEMFFMQVFNDKFFHADMHPGNVWVSKINPSNPKFILLDFGIMGTISDIDQKYMVENILGFIKQDYRKIAKLHISSGWMPNDTSVDELEKAICCIWEPIFNKRLKDISFEKTILSLIHIARRFKMRVQPQLILFQKTLFTVEGLSRQLCPDLDLWKIIRPVLEEWMLNRINPKIFTIKIKDRMIGWADEFLYNENVINKTNNNNSSYIKGYTELPTNNNYIVFLLVASLIILFIITYIIFK